ncbi:hypothetical protein CsSME_00031266 [Camellia sinensis var. sinensis]
MGLCESVKEECDYFMRNRLHFHVITWRVGRDTQPVMREAYNMFRDGGDPEKLVAAFSRGRESEYFYASLYAGLYYESQVC